MYRWAARCAGVPLQGDAARRAGMETRPWRFCPVCGRRREIASRPAPKSLPPSALPSTLLVRGWTGLLAEDAAGRVTLRCSDGAARWSLLGAGNKSLHAGSRRWTAWLGHVRDILTERYGGVGVQRFDRDPSRTKAEVIAVAVEAERRLGIRSPEP